jgi:hypothetical protein
LKNDVKFAIKDVIDERVAVEDDDVVVEMDHHDVKVVRELQVVVERVEPVDNDVHDVRRIDVMVENDDVEEVQTIATVVDDDDEVVVDDYIETVVIDETVDIID